MPAPNFGQLVHSWFKRQMANPYDAYYLYFKPAVGEIAGEIRIETEAPEGFELADSRRIAPGLTIDQVRRNIWDIWHTLPVLAVGPDGYLD